MGGFTVLTCHSVLTFLHVGPICGLTDQLPVQRDDALPAAHPREADDPRRTRSHPEPVGRLIREQILFGD